MQWRVDSVDRRNTLPSMKRRGEMGNQRNGRFFTAAESAQIWDRRWRGDGLIGRVFGNASSSIFAHMRPHGGIRPTLRRRSSRG